MDFKLSDKIKVRIFPEHNYKSIYFNGKTMRLQLDGSKPITELHFPEFYDIKLTDKCKGNCKFCYMDSKEGSHHFENVLEKIEGFFGSMSDNERPFQVAIGGGEPTLHPDFIKVLRKFRELGISPNYTTNGMHITNEIVEASKELCEGVAVSCHPHLNDHWEVAFEKLVAHGVNTNFHIIISDKDSVDTFIEIFKKYEDVAFYFVLLPYEEAGRAKKKDTDFDYLFERLKELEDLSKVAFGALFYPYLKDQSWIGLSLYEPEIMSKYLDMETMTLYPSSFSVDKPIRKVSWKREDVKC